MAGNESQKNGESRYSVPNLERALEILEHLVNFPEGLSLMELTQALEFPKNSVFRITTTLLNKGYLVRDGENKRFTLSSKLLTLGHRALSEKPLVPLAIDLMHECRDALKETVLIGTLVETECVVLEQVLGSHPFKFSIDLGIRIPLHVSAPGKALLAYLPEKELQSVLDRIKLARFNEKTITTKHALQVELRHVRECGYALDRGEQLQGIHCVAAPVFNQHRYPVAAIWTTGPIDRLPSESFAKVGAVMREYADRISARLGCVASAAKFHRIPKSAESPGNT
jgi:DNA-binding IclR family transcriptional regulator